MNNKTKEVKVSKVKTKTTIGEEHYKNGKLVYKKEEPYQHMLDSAKQVKSWNKYGTSLELSPLLVSCVGFLVGLAVAMIIATPSILQMCN